jgi:transposase-like protein
MKEVTVMIKEQTATPLLLSYRELYKMNKEGAREKLIETYKRTGSISETARLWGTSRNVVRKWLRRANEGDSLSDLSRRPKNSPRKTDDWVEVVVLYEKDKKNRGPMRLSSEIKKKYNISIHPNTVAKILKRNEAKTKKYRTIPGIKRSFYPHESVDPLTHFQVDVKEIADKKALPRSCYEAIFNNNLPRYQFTAICVRTRIRFVAYGYEKSCSNGIGFLVLVVMWLRRHGIKGEIIFQMDNGEEWGGMSVRKVKHIQEKILKPLNARMTRIRKGRAYENGVVERSHRIDDEEFYAVHLDKIFSEEDFLNNALRWTYIYNIERQHFGRYMDGNTPFEKLKSLIPNIKEEIALFPPFILDKIIPIYQHIPFAKKDKKIKMGSVRGSAPHKHSQSGNDLYVQYIFV